MDFILMAITDEVLALFREEIPGYLDQNWKEVPLDLDSDLYDCPRDDLEDAIRKYKERFNISLDDLNWSLYFPWEYKSCLQRWFKLNKKDVELTRRPLTIRMFATSAEAGKWLYD
ncbi:DUF1493 family protein [Cronobacter turicensis]|nr:DUF1493 family protein [Cronobacter turicensis]EKY1941870.1 DUF1493 family protein [Cronobacter turicensis]EKY1992393.1 DUF1493 family protein [Cronobacter turicensis]EKY3177678.1 DUF1493 family protein [Cronobacter turicensis]